MNKAKYIVEVLRCFKTQGYSSDWGAGHGWGPSAHVHASAAPDEAVVGRPAGSPAVVMHVTVGVGMHADAGYVYTTVLAGAGRPAMLG